MKILTRKKQNDAYQNLVDIIIALTKAYVVDRRLNLELQDAIVSAFKVVDIVGSEEMLAAMEKK